MYLHKKHQVVISFLVSGVRQLNFGMQSYILGKTFKKAHIMLQHGYLGRGIMPPPCHTQYSIHPHGIWFKYVQTPPRYQ